MARSLVWGPIGHGGNFAEWVPELRGSSGAYLIRSTDTHEIFYVGESHSGRLYETLTRHFQNWQGPTAGYTYDRNRVEVAVVVAPAGDAVDLQFDLIAEYEPRDNELGQGIDGDDEEIPF